MAITGSLLTASASGTNASSYATASISPGSNKLVLAFIASQDSIDTGAPTLSGNGLTWVEMTSFLYGASASRITLFRAMGSSPSAGAVTITPSSSGTGCCWAIAEFDGVDTGGSDGSAAIVQVVTDTAQQSPTITDTLAAYSAADNRPVAGFFSGRFAATEITAEAGWTELANVGHGSPQSQICLAWNSTTQDTSITFTRETSTIVDQAVFGIELKAAAGGGGTATVTGAGNIASGEAFGTHAFGPHFEVTPSGIASAEAFGTHAFAPHFGVTPSGVASLEAFGTATFTSSAGAVISGAGGIASGEAIGDHSLTWRAGITGSGVPSGEVIGDATFSTGALISGAGGIASGAAFGDATVEFQTGVGPSGIASAEAFGTHAFEFYATILPSGINAGAFGNPTFTVDGEEPVGFRDRMLRGVGQ